MITENGGLPPTVNPGTGMSGAMFGRTSGLHPHRLEIYADFIQKIGGIPQKPVSWRDPFFDNDEGLKW
jgi:hypothetical protein